MAPKRKRQNTQWSGLEKLALIKGVAKYGEGNWKMMLKDPDLSGNLKTFNSSDLAQQWGILHKMKEAFMKAYVDKLCILEVTGHKMVGNETRKEFGGGSGDAVPIGDDEDLFTKSNQLASEGFDEICNYLKENTSRSDKCLVETFHAAKIVRYEEGEAHKNKDN